MLPVGLERFESESLPSKEACYEWLDAADILLCVVGWRYGRIAAGDELSMTELEYERAVERGLELLVFVSDSTVGVHPDADFDEDEEHSNEREKLAAFKQRLYEAETPRAFTDDRLEAEILRALRESRARLDSVPSTSTSTEGLRDSPEADAESLTPERHDAFISYSHAVDGDLGPQLQRALQRIAVPWYRRTPWRLFLDQTNLSASPDLWPSIETALRRSRKFVLLASPKAAASKWVRKEVGLWVRKHGTEGLLIALTEGEIVWGEDDFDWTRTNALPPALASRFSWEPSWVDLRWARSPRELRTRNAKFLQAVARLAAPIRDVEILEVLSQDRAEVRQRWLSAAVAVAFSALLLILAVVFWSQAEASARLADQEAQHQREASGLRYLATGRFHLARGEWCEALPWMAIAVRVFDDLAKMHPSGQSAGQSTVARGWIADLKRRMPELVSEWTTLGSASQLDLSPSGEHALVLGDGFLALHSVADGVVLFQRTPRRFTHPKCAFSPDGTKLYVVFTGAEAGPLLESVDTSTGNATSLGDLGSDALIEAHFDPARGRLGLLQSDSNSGFYYRLVDLSSGEFLGEQVNDCVQAGYDAELFSTHHDVAVVTGKDAVHLLRLSDGTQRATIDLGAAMGATIRPQIDEAGSRLILVFAGVGVTVHDLKTGVPHPKAVSTELLTQSGALSPDGKRLALVGRTRDQGTQFKLVQLSDPFRVLNSETVPDADGRGGTVRYAPDGKSIAAVINGTLHVWDVSGTQVSRSQCRGRLAVTEFEYSPSGSHIATSSGDQRSSDLTRIQVWDASGQPVTPELLGCMRPSWGSTKTLSSLFVQGSVRTWELPDDVALASFRVHGRSIFGDVPYDFATHRFVVADPAVPLDRTRLLVRSLDDGETIAELPELPYPVAQCWLAGERIWSRSVRWTRAGEAASVDLRCWSLEESRFVESSKHVAAWFSRGGIVTLDERSDVTLRGFDGAPLLHVDAPDEREILSVRINRGQTHALILRKEPGRARRAIFSPFALNNPSPDYWAEPRFVSPSAGECGPPETPEEGEREIAIGSVELWNLRTGKRQMALPETDYVRAQFTSDGARLIAERLNDLKEVNEVWNVVTGLRLGPGLAGDVRYSFDASLALVHRTNDSAPRLVDVATGQPYGQPLLHGAAALGSFAEKGSTVVTRSGQDLRLWEARSAEPMSLPYKHESGISFYRLVSTNLLLSATLDGWIHAWKTTPDTGASATIDEWARSISCQEVAPSGQLFRVDPSAGVGSENTTELEAMHR